MSTIRGSPTCPSELPAPTIMWCGPWCLQSLSCVQLFVTLWTVALQAPLSMGLSRQEYWTGLPFLPPGDLPKPGIELMSSMSLTLQAESLPTEPSGKPLFL